MLKTIWSRQKTGWRIVAATLVSPAVEAGVVPFVVAAFDAGAGVAAGAQFGTSPFFFCPVLPDIRFGFRTTKVEEYRQSESVQFYPQTNELVMRPRPVDKDRPRRFNPRNANPNSAKVSANGGLKELTGQG